MALDLYCPRTLTKGDGISGVDNLGGEMKDGLVLAAKMITWRWIGKNTLIHELGQRFTSARWKLRVESRGEKDRGEERRIQEG